MNPLSPVHIDPSETFPNLAHAPIIEALFGVIARATTPWDESTIVQHLKSTLPDYPVIVSSRLVQQSFQVFPSSPKQEAPSPPKDLGWNGVRCTSQDKLQIATFLRDTFSFSRLSPYGNWEQFRGEALRLWGIHQAVAKPAQIERMELRYIDRIPVIAGVTNLEEVLHAGPKTPRDLDLPFGAFLHQDTLLVPGHPYSVNIVRTVQGGVPGLPETEAALLLDISVGTTVPFEPTGDKLEKHLANMRWLKNKAFFGSVSPQALESMR
jgi:uncharacterized protein (TIGR04255 family)